MQEPARAAFPDGIDDSHDDPPGWLRRSSSSLALLLLGAVIATGLSGVLGGVDSAPVSAAEADAILTVETRDVLRNGEFFETRIKVEARRPVADAVLSVSSALWRDMTVNSMIPAPSEETFERGSYTFSFGPLEPGATLEIKLDGQINPPLFGGTRGTVALSDGDRLLARIPLAIRVLP